MKNIFSEISYRRTWRDIWLALAEAQSSFGLVSTSELQDLRRNVANVNIDRSHHYEEAIKHDLMAELKVFAEQSRVGGGKLHMGATSADIEDNADVLRMGKALDILLTRLVSCLDALAEKIMEYRATVCMAWTHLQSAETTTLGYRFANYAQDLVLDLKLVEFLRREILRGKGIKGAVGTSASFVELLGQKTKPGKLEELVANKLGIEIVPVATQTYPRKIDFVLLSVLASMTQSAQKFGLDVRILQSPAFGEMGEPIAKKQVGSSAMPFKRNPVKAERMCSLGRYVGSLPQVALQNASLTMLERTLDDSGNRRIILPEAFLATEECLTIYQAIVKKLNIYPAGIKRNVKRFGEFAGVEALLSRLASMGADRQLLHEKLRQYSFTAWEAVMSGQESPLFELLIEDSTISSKIGPQQIKKLLNPARYTGDATERCDQFLKNVINPLRSSHKNRLRKQPTSRF